MYVCVLQVLKGEEHGHTTAVVEDIKRNRQLVLDIMVDDHLQKLSKARMLSKERRDRIELLNKRKGRGIVLIIDPAAAYSKETDYYKYKLQHFMTSQWVEHGISVLILVNSVALALYAPGNSAAFNEDLYLINLVVGYCHLVEMVLKILMMGWRPYYDEFWNKMDICISIFVVMFITLPDPVSSIGRGLVAIRLMRVIVRIHSVRVLVQAFFYGIPAIGTVALFCALFWIIFGILGVNLFAGKFWSCSDPTFLTEVDCLNSTLAYNG